MHAPRTFLALAALCALTLSLLGCPVSENFSGPGGNASSGGNSALTPGRAGTLDGSFGDGGIVITDFTDGKDDVAQAVALQADGKIVAAGTTMAPNPVYTVGTFALVRYLPSGVPDATFGAEGRVFTAQGSTAQGRAVAVAKDGTIVTAGWMHGSAMDVLLSRHLANGKLDASFGDEGHVTGGYGNAVGNALALQADGKILVTGYYGLLEYKPIVLRYTRDGILDASFDGDGKLTLDWGSDEDMAEAIAVQLDGKIVVAGSAKSQGFVVTRLNPDGTRDTTFGTEGTVAIEAEGNRAKALALATDGSLVVAGGDRVVKLTPSGAVDERFGVDGWVKVAGHQIRAVAMQSDQKVLLAGSSSKQAVVLRLRPDGKPDTGFGQNGTAKASVPEAETDVNAIAIQPDGRIVVAGRATDLAADDEDFFLMRLWP